MRLLERLHQIWSDNSCPFFIDDQTELSFAKIASQNPIDLSLVKTGDVVALVGDFNAPSILTLLRLIDLGAIVLPLTAETTQNHDYFFESALVDLVIKNNKIIRRTHSQTHPLLTELRKKKHAGLIIFSTGTTGNPKAILHDLTQFLKRFEVTRHPLRTISFLLFDHIGGLNTLFHTLFNKGIIISPKARTISSVLEACAQYEAELLPTTPTFLRMLLMSNLVPNKIPASLKVISYGTERMDQSTLNELCRLLPHIDFRQTFGSSELGIVRAKSKDRNSLFMKIGGEGIKVRVVENQLHICSESRMLGYLNAESPFNAEGWYNTGDLVEEENGYLKVIGRSDDIINVGGLKFMKSQIESLALNFPGILFAKAYSKQNPITGQHVELLAEPKPGYLLNKDELMTYMKSKLPSYMVPKRIFIKKITIGHRFKQI